MRRNNDRVAGPWRAIRYRNNLAASPAMSAVTPKAEVNSERWRPRYGGYRWCRARNLVERFFNKIEPCRRVATRYDKLAANYLAFIKLASIRIWLRANGSTR